MKELKQVIFVLFKAFILVMGVVFIAQSVRYDVKLHFYVGNFLLMMYTVLVTKF